MAAPASTTADDALYQALLRRDAAADGLFVYSVRSTGIYCRPSCGARLPRPENVRFHESCADAESQGFRACKRCRPRETSLAARQSATIAQICRLVDIADEPPSLEAMAAQANLSPFHFHRLFRKITGVTPKAYVAAARAGRAREALTGRASVTEALYAGGFQSAGRFYAASGKILGMKPKNFQRRGAGEAIRFAIGETSLGCVLVAATEKGVCAVLLGDEPEALLHDLERRFANAQLIGADSSFEHATAKIIASVEDPRLGLELPLDIRGTLLQLRVWNALSEIPPGSTATYSEIAAKIGAPNGSRAVAAACAANAIAIAIPCHRVVRKGGDLSGYRWGIERKRTLLARERS